MRSLMPIIEALQALPEEPSFNPDDVTAVLTEYRVTTIEFLTLDDTPGRYGGRDWHWKLRRWRNTRAGQFTFDAPPRCKRCGALKSYNHETGRYRCLVEHVRWS